MATSLRAFDIGLYQEHLEEISFLYEQRGALLRKGELSWHGLAPFEERLDAHLDALVVGSELATEVCRNRAADGDPTEMYGCVGLSCRARLARLLADLLRDLDFEDQPAVMSVLDALKHELPIEWTGFVANALRRHESRLAALLTEVAGFRRLECAATLLDADDVEADRKARLRALGRVRHRAAAALFWRHLDADDPGVRYEAMIGLARIGDRQSIDEVEARVQRDPVAQMVAGIGGLRGSVGLLRDLLEAGGAGAQATTALGILGDPTCVPVLIEALTSPPIAAEAADALQLLSGAGLYEDVFAAESPQPDEMFDDERKAFEMDGVAPLRKDGRPYGQSLRQVIRDPDVWRTWWNEHGSSAKSGSRYRLGRPFTASAAVSCLASDAVSPRLRGFLCDEFVARFGVDAGLESDALVRAQFIALRRMHELAPSLDSRLVPGGWHLGGIAA